MRRVIEPERLDELPPDVTHANAPRLESQMTKLHSQEHRAGHSQ
jgi:hypothetical protein